MNRLIIEKTLSRLVLVGLILINVSCGSKTPTRNLRGSVQLNLIESYGAVKAKVTKDAVVDQVITINLEGSSPKLRVKLPVGSVKQNDLLSVSEGIQFDPVLLKKRTNYPMDLHPVGVPILVKLESGNEVAAPVVISLNRPQTSLQSLSSENFVVLYRMINRSGAVIEGIIPAALVSYAESSYVSFSAKSLGVYQLASVSTRSGSLTDHSLNNVVEVPSNARIWPSLGNNAPIRVYNQTATSVMPGQTISVTGENFQNVAGVMRGAILDGVRVVSSTELEVTIPTYAPAGVQRISFRQNGLAAAIWVVVNETSHTDLVVSTEANNVCNGKSSMNFSDDSNTGDFSVCAGVSICTQDGQTGCVTSDAMPAISKSALSAVQSSSPSPTASTAVAVATVAPATSSASTAVASTPTCAADGQVGCITTARYKSLDTTAFSSGDVRTGKSLGGVSGTLGDCNVDGQTSCVTGTNFPAVKVTGLAAKVVSGSSVAGVNGSYTPDFPSADYVLETVTTNHVSGRLKLPAASNVSIANGAYGAGGNTSTPLLRNCDNDGLVGCVAVSAYPAVDKVAKLLPASIKSGVTIAGIQGSLVAAPGACSQDNQTSCVANANFPAIDLTLVSASNIKSGITIVGVTGNYGGGAIADCASDGEVGCKAVTAFRAIDATKIVASNIKQGVMIGSTTGSLVAAPNDCNDDGLVGCVTVAAFPSVKLANYAASSLKSGVVVGGVTGSLADCSSDGQTSCITVATYKSVDMSHAVAGNIRNGISVGGVSGSLVVAPNDCASDGAVGCVTTAAYKSADMTKAVAGNILSAVTIAGVAGAVVASPGSCTVDGAGSCVVDGTTYKAALMTNVVATHIKTGTTIAGVSGSVTAKPSDCSADGAIGCVTTSSYKSADMTKAVAGNILSSVTIAGVTGTVTASPGLCIFDGGGSCVVDGTTYKAALMTNVLAGNILGSVTIAGVTGSVTAKPSDCSADGSVGCVTTSSYKSADMTKAIAGNILNSTTIAGITGSVTAKPSDCSADGSVGCVTTTSYKSADMTKAIAGNILSSVTIAGVTGSVTASPGSCSTDGAGSCVVDGSTYKAALMTSVIAGNIKSGATIAGVSGSVTPKPSDCSADGSTGCVTTIRYKSADTSAYSDADFKSGKTIGGISGAIASCTLDGQQTCFIDTTSMFKAANSTGLTSSMIQSGIQLAGVTGTKMDIRICKNTDDISTFDNTTSPAVSGSADIFDSIDDYNAGSVSYPATNPWLATNACNSSNFTVSSGTQYTATDGLTGMVMTSVNPQGSTKTWAAAISACKALTWNSVGPNVWRLPTQKELIQLYIDGASRLDSTKMGNLNQLFWTSTTQSDLVTQAWSVNLATGYSSTISSKTLTSNSVICVK